MWWLNDIEFKYISDKKIIKLNGPSLKKWTGSKKKNERKKEKLKYNIKKEKKKGC